MDWKTLNFDWNRARAFLVTAEEGSLSAAAQALRLTQSTVGRQVTALEKELGVSLFERVGRGLQITPNGLALIEHVKAMGEAANRFSLAAAGKLGDLDGSVCISATEATSIYVLPPLLKKLRDQQPGIQIEGVVSNASSDLQRREADIAIRNFQPKQGELIARKLPDTKVGLYATPAYLESLGRVRTAEDLSGASFMGFVDNADYLKALTGLGLRLTERNFPYRSANHLAQWEMVKQGAGIGVMLDWVGQRESGVQRLDSVIVDFPLVETWLVTHRELRTNRRIRVVYDFLYRELSSLLGQD